MKCSLTWAASWVRWSAAVCWGRTPSIWSSGCRGSEGSFGASLTSRRSLSGRSRHYSSRPGRAWCRTWGFPTYTHLRGDQHGSEISSQINKTNGHAIKIQYNNKRSRFNRVLCTLGARSLITTEQYIWEISHINYIFISSFSRADSLSNYCLI